MVKLWNELDPRCGHFGGSVPAITTEEVWGMIVEFDVADIELLKLDGEGAECTILESPAEQGHLPQVGWICGE